MAESDSYTKNPDKANANPSKFHNHTHILYKVLTAIFFLVILPLVPSQAPEFINQTLLTRSWELLHLLFVGIAVSYGLFSRRNDDQKKDYEFSGNHSSSSSSKFDNAQSYVSGLLQVSSVFDDEAETPFGSDETLIGSDENKVMTWKSRYFRNETVPVVVSEERKPLLLPVRSLKSRVIAKDDGGGGVGEEFKSASESKLRVGSKRFSSKAKRSVNGEFGGGGIEEMGDNLSENVVLRSPIPWRSRSGRMEMKGDDDDNASVYPVIGAMEESGTSKSQISRSSRPITTAPKLSSSPSLTPRKSSPLPTVSPESQAKSAEDLVWKKSFYRSPPPPPPPPPPPLGARRISSMKPSSWLNDSDIPHDKDLRRSVTSKPRDRIRDMVDDDMVIGANSSVEVMPRTYVDSSQSMAKSVRKNSGGEALTESTRRGNELKGKMDRNVQSFEENPIEFQDEVKEELIGKVVMETDDDMESEEEDDMGGDFLMGENERRFTATPKGNEESSNDEEGASSSMASDGGPDVDKKADEFIAKFREQIRLQRIESIKRSSGQIRRNSSRQT